MKTKICVECGEEKEINKFPRKGKGYGILCIECSEMNLGKPAKAQNKRNKLVNLLPKTSIKELKKQVFKKFGKACAITGSKKFDMEHMIPCAWGHGGRTLKNIYPMCKALNYQKGSKNPLLWMNSLPSKQKNNFIKVLNILAKENNLSYDEYCDFINWCYRNQRTVDQVKADNERGLTSIDLWKQSLTN